MTTSKPRVRITPESKFTYQDLIELWEYRYLIWMLVIRAIKTRYKQTVLGFIWPVLQPLVMMVVFTFIFGQLAKLPTDGGLPHPLFIYSGLIPWQFFAAGLSGATGSLVSNAPLMTKVYFPRLALPVINVITGIFDTLISLSILIFMALAYGYYPTIHIIFLPFFLIMAALLAFALGLWFSALNVRIRDIGFGISFLVRIWLYLTPVAYSSTALPSPYDKLYILNPMASVVEGFRWTIFAQGDFPLDSILLSLSIMSLVLVSGLYYFKHVEVSFADVV